MITYKLHFIRTGSTQDGTPRRYVGQSDFPLSDQGVDDLEKLKEAFDYPKLQMIYSSPLVRCQQTADILYPNTQVVLHDGLMDMNLGTFEGKTFEQLKTDTDFTNWIKDSYENTPPGGEEITAFTERIVGAVEDIFHDMMDQGLSDVGIVTHGGVIMNLFAGIGLPKLAMHQWAVENGTGYTVLMTPQMWMRDRSMEIYRFFPTSPEENMDFFE